MKKMIACACVLSLGFVSGCGKNERSGKYEAGTDILPKLKFESGGSIVFRQNQTLKLSSSLGWAWAFLPEEVDINRFPRLTLCLKTHNACEVYLELKDKQGRRENALVGKTLQNNMWKVKLDLPDTDGDYRDVVIDLTEHYRPGIKDRLVKVFVFSDPSGTIEIRSIKFDEK